VAGKPENRNRQAGESVARRRADALRFVVIDNMLSFC
jgi:hypothetical protein